MLPLLLIAAAGAVLLLSKKSSSQSKPSGEAVSYFSDGEDPFSRATGIVTRDFGDMSALAASASPMPEGVVISDTVGADAPMVPGERVTFSARRGDESLGVYEGVYAGPEDPSSAPQYVLVDRVASSGATGVDPLPNGQYQTPASSKSSYHTRLDRVVWTAIAPADAGLAGFLTVPVVDVGDKVTLVVKDIYGTKVVAIGLVKGKSEGSFDVLLLQPYRTLEDKGERLVVFPRVYNQALVTLRSIDLVNPKSIPAAS